MVGKANPLISEVLDKNAFNYEDTLSLNKIDFRLAFSVENYKTRERKDDPRFVKYLVRVYGINEGVEFEEIVPYHRCNDEDWAKFPPAADNSADSIETIKEDPNRGMYCLDWEEADFNVFGNEKND